MEMKNLNNKLKAASYAAAMLMTCAPAAFAAAETAATAEQLKFFETRIRPVLAENCYECHGEQKQKAGLRLDNIGYILAGSEDGQVLVPGDASKSLVYTAITHVDPDLQMPKKADKLPDNQIEDIRKWIEMGAPWPENEVVKAAKSGEFTEAERAWWSFQPLQDVTPPNVDPATGIVKNDVDKFILAKLKEKGLKQAPEATPEELVRRLYFNMHGLPPTNEELDTYLADKDPEKYEKLVEKLLASPRYGERWGQHWLDLSRYAESDGYRQDGYRPDAWPYRDYVIKSFNEDKPYDQFVREQLAGDEIAPEDPDVLVATGYLRHGIYEWNQADAENQRELIETELADVTGELFLGLSYGCAKCHDHKFDPILQKDYFRMRSFFAPVQWRDDLPLATVEEKKAHAEAMAKWEAESKDAREAWEKASAKSVKAGHKRALAFFPAEVQDMEAKPEAERTPYEKQITYLVERRMAVEKGRALERAKKDSKEYKAYEPFLKTKPKGLQTAFVATDVGTEAPPTTMKTRRSDTVIKPGFLSIIAPDDIDVKPLEDKNSTGRRLALANWITSPENPLSTRVIVNRVWQYHFGRGLSVHTSDFGKLGEAPTHPELLDWLTKGFIKNGWSIKWLHRQILKTQTYRQSSIVASTDLTNKVDPENKLLWRMRPQRLDAEQARDTLLALGDELKEKSGGSASDPKSPVPSIYTKKQRNNPDEFLSRFDAPPGFMSVAKRETTNTPLQSLLLINGSWPLQRSKSIAASLLKSNPTASSDELAEKAFRTVYGRTPESSEVQAAAAFLAKQQKMIESEGDGKSKASAEETNPLVDAAKYFKNSAGAGEQSVFLKEGTDFQKLRINTDAPEPLDFTLEAMVNLESVYPSGAVRTIASRWDGDTVANGWAVGVTSARSRFEPNMLIVQAVGEDFQGALASEVINSGLKIPSGKPYYVSVVFSTETLPGKDFGGNVTFYAKDLSDPKAKMQVSQVAHELGDGYVNPDFDLVMGGRHGLKGQQWFGAIHRFSITEGAAKADELPFKAKGNPLVSLTASDLSSSDHKSFSWIRSSDPAAQTRNPSKAEALGDLFHALINSNEFLYLP